VCAIRKQQIHAYYWGNVQGVGFRFTVEADANELGVAGWVKNLRDGRVEVVAEAEEGALKDFLDKVSRYFSRHIQSADVDWREVTGELMKLGYN
jgi:acylphosphatase